MATRLATATQNAGCDAQVDRLDVGTTNPGGKIRVYSGTQPASANVAPTGDLLAEFDLDNPAFGDAASGVATVAGLPLSTVGAAAGTAGWCRAVNRDEATVFDGSVTETGGGGQMQLDNLSIAVGQTVTLTAGTYTQPAQ